MMIKNGVIHMKAHCIRNEVSYQREDTGMSICVNRATVSSMNKKMGFIEMHDR